MSVLGGAAARRRRRKRAFGYVPLLSPDFWFEPTYSGLVTGAQTGRLLRPVNGPIISGSDGTAVDTNDPTWVAAAGGVPAKMQSVDDFLAFGTDADSIAIFGPIINSPTGFTLYWCLEIAAGDLTATQRYGLSMLGGNATILLRTSTGILNLVTYASADGVNYTIYKPTAAMTAGRWVACVTYDPTLARLSRGIWYLNNNTPVAATNILNGTDGPIPAVASVHRYGYRGSENAILTQGGIGAYKGAHTPTQVGTVITDLRTVYGWQ